MDHRTDHSPGMQSAVAMSVHATATVICQALELERHSLGFVEKPGLNQAG